MRMSPFIVIFIDFIAKTYLFGLQHNWGQHNDWYCRNTHIEISCCVSSLFYAFRSQQWGALFLTLVFLSQKKTKNRANKYITAEIINWSMKPSLWLFMHFKSFMEQQFSSFNFWISQILFNLFFGKLNIIEVLSVVYRKSCKLMKWRVFFSIFWEFLRQNNESRR